MSTAYPLQWPFGWPRLNCASVSKFGDRTVHQSVQGVLHELDLMRATDVVISSNVTLGPAPKDKGVCVYFKLKGKPYALPCDKWNAVEDNLWALAKHIESLRLQERWGVGTVERAFSGYMALPPPSDKRSCWEQIGFTSATSTFAVAQEAYRARAKQCHPDNGGSNEAMSRLNSAWQEIRAHFGQ